MLFTTKKHIRKSNISTPIAQTNSMEIPKKIIRALFDYHSKSANELSFKKGDFFHVIGRENDLDYFEACNPIKKQSGIVPISYFEVVKSTTNRHDSLSTLDSGFSDTSTSSFYGTVIYDFKAERPNELNVRAGEAIIIITQLNSEWYVAKPIDGEPGLIPISFVQIRDIIINQDNRISNSSTSTTQSCQNSLVTFTSIDSFIHENGQFWFIIYAYVNPKCHRILYRLYEDFYDFQITLLNKFPIEAGKFNEDRILPFMPGPLSYVDEEVTAERQVDLNLYCKQLLNLPKYISESDIVQNQLFGVHQGDIELDYDPRIKDELIHPTEPQEYIKIKIIYKDDIFIIKVSIDCSMYYLKSKIFERTGTSQIDLTYRNESSNQIEPFNTESHMEKAFIQAIKKGKLTVIASTTSCT